MKDSSVLCSENFCISDKIKTQKEQGGWHQIRLVIFDFSLVNTLANYLLEVGAK